MPRRAPLTTTCRAATVIQADCTAPLLDVRELWRFRELLGFLAWRDLRVRYRQTLLGATWALIEPLAGVALFTLLLHRLAGVSSGSVPYPLYCGAALALWGYFARCLRAATVSLVANASLITKAYFPRLILPLAAQLATTVDLLCALLAYGVMAAWYGSAPGAAVFTLPIWALLAALNALGIGFVLAAVNVRYRDVSQAVSFLTQVWMFATPVVYPLQSVPARWMLPYLLNPMVGVIEGTRWALLPDYPFDPTLLWPSVLVTLACLAAGLLTFRRAERRFADIV